MKLTSGVCRSKKRLDGKTVIVTGVNTGIGKETARDLAERGAKVILACRNLEKGKKACDDIIASTGNAIVEVQHLDLSSLASVRKFALNIINTEPRLDVLINNAGATRVKQKITEDGLLLGMQVNHFGPFLLTCLLTAMAYPGFFFRGGGQQIQLRTEDREKGIWGRSPLVRGSGGSCNLVKEISFHIVKFS